MKTIKLIAVLALTFAASAASAADSYLYWMVEDATYGGSDVDFEYATISVDGGSSYLSLYSPGASSSETQYLLSNGGNASYGAPSGVYAGFTGEVSSFLVELWNDSDARVGWASYNYNSLAEYIYKTTSGGVATTPFGVTDVVPEPTSGLLSLFGLAALALRRRRRA